MIDRDPMRSTLLFALVLCLFLPFGVAHSALQKAIVTVKLLESRELFDLYSYPAVILSKIQSQLISEIDGIVKSVPAPLGKTVKRDEALVVLRNTDPIYQYSQFILRSPINGVVSQLEVSPGTQVVKGSKIGFVTDPVQKKLQIEVPALDLPAFKGVEKAEFIPDGQKDSIPVKLVGLSPLVNPQTGTAVGELEFARPIEFSPGTLGQVKFKLNSRSSLSAPEHAILYKGAQPYVRVLENGKAKHVTVTLGRRQLGEIEILSGLQTNQQLIERASRFVADGEEVGTNKENP